MNWPNTLILMLTAFSAVFLQSWLAGPRNLLGAQVDFLPVLMVYAALTENLVTLALVAALGGLWLDSLSANPLGISILPLAAVGLAIHYHRGMIFRGAVHIQFLFGTAACVAVPVLTLLLLKTAGAEPLVGWASLWQWVVVALGGGAATPVIFWLLDRLSGALNYPMEPSVSFRADREIQRGRNAHANH